MKEIAHLGHLRYVFFFFPWMSCVSYFVYDIYYYLENVNFMLPSVHWSLVSWLLDFVPCLGRHSPTMR